MKKPENNSNCYTTEPIDPRVRRTQKLLHDALRKLLNERRLSAITVQDITECATVNRATFYAHYMDKHDLTISVLREDFRNALMQRYATPPPVTYENLVEFAVIVFEFLGNVQSGCPETAQELRDMLSTTIQGELSALIEHWLSDSSVRSRLFPGARKETVATVLSWSIYGGAYNWTRSGRALPVTQVCREIVNLLLSSSALSTASSATQ